MHHLPVNIKQLFFDKGTADPLTADEQAFWDEYAENEHPQNGYVDPDDPLFKIALKEYIELKEEDLFPLEKLEQIISQVDVPLPVIPPAKKTGWLIKLVSAAAVVLLVIAGIWMYKQSGTGQPEKITETAANKVNYVSLPDGSIVWLNKGATLTYQKEFASGERNVELAGEAFFKVTPDPSKPFRVTVGKTAVIVRGTAFNVKENPANNSVITTLKEGKVTILLNNDSVVLKPGEQAIVTDTIQVIPAGNTDEMLAWKKAFIKLGGEAVQSVMEQIKQHYNVDYFIEPGLPPLDLTGRLSTDNSLDSIIQFLNDASDEIRFTLKDKKVTVTRK